MEWLRWYHGACSDDKWPLIARKANVPQAFVVAVWAMLLEVASQDEERGSVEEFDAEAVDALLGMPDGSAQAIVDALSGGKKPRIVDGCINSWSKRQVQDEGNAERKRLQREREKLQKEREELEALRHELSQKDSEILHDVTPCHGMSQPVTECHLEQNRTEKNREEKKEERGENSPTPAPPPPRQKKPQPPPKTSYGEYQRVKLTADEYTRLEGKCGADTLAAAITKLDLHIEAKGKDEYKSHAAAMQKWVFTAIEQDRQRSKASPAASGNQGGEWKSTAQRRHDANKAECEKFINGDLDWFGVSNAGQ